MITYEFVAARKLADQGTVSPVPLMGPFPAIIIPTGSITLKSASSEWEIGKGQCILLRHAEPLLCLQTEENLPLPYVHGISLQSYRLARREENSLLYVIDPEQLPEHGKIMEFPHHAGVLLGNLLEWSRQEERSTKLHLLLHELLDAILVKRLDDSVFLTKDNAMKQTIAYIHLHYGAPLTRSFLAKQAGFNESYFSSLFRKEIGWSYAGYLNQVRIDQAKYRLLATNDKLQDIASQTGFADGSYLGKTFNKIVHMSPGVFREKRGRTRIVGLQFVGALLALGIQPLAATREVLRSSLLIRDHLPDIVELEDFDQAQVVGTLQPDFIVAPTYLYSYPDTLKSLERIAPVLTMPWGQLDKLEEVRVLGRLLDRNDEAEHWIDRLHRKAETAKKIIANHLTPGATVGIYELWHDDSWMIPHLPVRSAYNLFQLLELAPPPLIKQEVLSTGRHRHVPEKAIGAYAASHMFLIVPAEHTESYRNKLMQRAVWQRLVHEQGCRLHLINLNDFWLDDGLSLELQLEILVKLLTSSHPF